MRVLLHVDHGLEEVDADSLADDVCILQDIIFLWLLVSLWVLRGLVVLWLSMGHLVSQRVLVFLHLFVSLALAKFLWDTNNLLEYINMIVYVFAYLISDFASLLQDRAGTLVRLAAYFTSEFA